MPAKKREQRYGHSDGHNSCCFNASGSRLVTGGSDGDVRIWSWASFEDDDAESFKIGECVYALAVSDEKFFTASDDSSVRAHLMSDGSQDGVLLRFTAPVTHMCFNSTGRKLFAGASDFHVKMVDLDSNIQTLFQNHEAPVLSLAVHPNEKYLASSSCDGTVKIWQIESQSVVKTLKILPKSNDFSASQTLCRMAWTKDGKNLAVPVDKEVKVYNSETWDVEFTLSDNKIKEVVSIVSISPCGNYVAAGCRDGAIIVWDLKKKHCTNSDNIGSKSTPTSLEWNPNGKLGLVCIDNQGSINVFEGIVTSSESTVKKPDSDVALADQYADLFDDDDDEALLAATCQTESEIASAQQHQSSTTKIADDDSDDDEMVIQRKKIRPEDEESRDSTFSGPPTRSAELSEVDRIVDGDSAAAPETKPEPTIIYRGIEPTPLQEPFQAGSTPEHLSHRFMVWNSVGLIRQYNTDEENSIDIEFHDTSTHHAMHVSNTMNHTMGDLSAEAAVLACESDDDSPSKLVCMHFSSWDNVKEWSVAMPDDEDIMAVTIGEGWLAVCTEKRLVRIFTLGGVQKEMFSLPGPVVCMSGHGSQLMVVYHSATGLPGEQCMSIQLMKVMGAKKKTFISGDRLPLSVKARLAWLGFSAEGTPFYVDTAGIVSMLNKSFGNTWIQVADTRKHCKGKSDHQFVVGIHENPTQLRVIPCKGSRFPPTLPRPAVHILKFELPLCDLSTEKGQLENTYWQKVLFSGHLDHLAAEGYDVDDAAREEAALPQQELLLKMFALACKSEHEFRAVELAALLPSQHAVQLAIKYASHRSLLPLVQRLNDVARAKAEEQLQNEDEEETEQAPSRVLRAVPAAAPARTAASDDEMEASDGAGAADVSADIYEELDDQDQEQDEEKGPMLKLKTREQDSAPPHKPLSQVGQQRKNPFRLGSQVTPKAAQGTSVFDSMQRSSSKSKSLPTTTEIKPKPIKLKKQHEKSQSSLFGSKKSVKENISSQDEPSPFETLTGESEKKRKRDETEAADKTETEDLSESAAKKRPLSTNDKLSAFAFNKS